MRMGNVFSYINWIDVIIIVVIVFYAVEGYFTGAVHAFFDFIKFIISFLFGLKFYGFFGSLFVRWFAWPQGIAKAVGFFVAIFLIELLLHLFLRSFFSRLSNSLTGLIKKLNHWIGFVLGGISGVLFMMFLLSLVISVPVYPAVKKAVASSSVANLLMSQTQGLEKSLQGVFGGATQETLNFLTVEPKSNSLMKLDFTAKGTVDETSEQQMLQMVNDERAKRGLASLSHDAALQNVARAHADDMLQRGYFSHFTPEGLSPFDRMNNAGISYQYAGENLAFSPDVQLAMQGLMNSPGHRENILSPHFGKAGIGVLDAGIYGKMFVQEFTD